MGAMFVEESIKGTPGLVTLEGVTRTGVIAVTERDRAALKKTVLVSTRLMADAGAMTLAVLAAYWLRFENATMTGAFKPEVIPSFGELLVTFLLGIPLLLFYLNTFELYNVYRNTRLLDQIPRIIGAVNAFLITMLVITFILGGTEITRGYLIMFWLACVVFVLLGRTLLQLMLNLIGVKNVIMRNTVIVGSGEVGKNLALKLKKHHQFGLDPIGFIDDDPLFERFDEEEIRDLRVLGGIGEMEELLSDYNVGKVVVAFSGVSHEQLLDLSATCSRLGVEISIVPRLFEVITNEVKITEVGGIPLILLRSKTIRGFSRFLKTLEDYALASVIFLLIWPILLATAIAIKLDSPGPVFFKHRRIGRGGKPFGCLKFRSMVANAAGLQALMVEEDNADWLCWKQKEDPRVTRVGKFIRRFSIDELPQVFNVLGGQMSLVGPRPHIQEEVDSYQEWHTPRLNVKPGITGIWQVSGRSDIPFDEMVKLDLYYIERWSLWQDFKILMRTVSAVLRRDGAY